MKRLPAAVLALLTLVGLGPVARADIATPPPPPPVSTQKVKLIVLTGDNLKETHLRIPQNLLPAAAKTEKGSEASLFTTPTVVAGLALTLAFASGGFWLARRSRARTAAAAVLVLALVGAGASAVWADIPRPPRRPFVQPPVELPAGIQLSENIVLEIVLKGDTITLIVDKNSVLKADKPEDKSGKE